MIILIWKFLVGIGKKNKLYNNEKQPTEWIPERFPSVFISKSVKPCAWIWALYLSCTLFCTKEVQRYHKFVPDVKQFCATKSIDYKLFLLLDNVPAHPPTEKPVSADGKVIIPLPPNSTSISSLWTKELVYWLDYWHSLSLMFWSSWLSSMLSICVIKHGRKYIAPNSSCKSCSCFCCLF